MIPRIREAVNPHYLRMQSLLQLAEKQYRHDVLSGNIPQYIYEEFKKARKAMGHVSLDLPENIYQREQMSWTVSTLKSVVGDSTMIYFAFLAIFVSHRASMAILTGILKAASELRFSFNILFWQASALLSGLSSLKELYKLQDRQLQPGIDGYMGYPIAKTGAETSQGMGLELRHVSFCYPGARKKALEDVSLTIHPGQIVAIVGENGSGKSTLINLLTRMYDATEGEVLIDGANIKSLKISDLRNAAAILTQQHKLLPLTLGENIGIGRPERIGDEEMILEAARRSGAEGVLRKLGSDNTKSGLKATVGRYVEQALLQVDPKNEEDPLHRVWKTMQKQTSVSGGEQQRLVAARTFMKMNDPSVKLVAVDEPTSALDPEAEMHLFSNLRTAREGRTMLFVTHRFGHLTKHADAIICMKGGKIVERGDHNSLMKLRGVYCGLFHAATKALARSDTEISGSGDQTSERSN
ncbi:hypothetical protein V5O48_009416 [Marasmius crinis-equi]|uniref:ABC transporter domain-containing protein n=1 Tax=Marasmius crinis-equi TaxID=585013 RepID=A0ABR3FB61_9AGAR